MHEYPYLVMSLVMLAACVAALMLFRRHRCPMLVSGILCAPFAFASVIFVPEYWQPRRVACFLAGPEDIVFSFSSGAFAWLAAAIWSYKRIEVSLRAARVIRRFSWIAAVFLVCIFLFREVLDLKTMPSVLLGGLPLYVLLLAIRPKLWRFSVLGGVTYGVVYSVFFIVMFSVFSEFSQQWNWENLLGLSIFGVPIEEVAFAFVFGAGWPLGIAYAFDT